MRGARVNGSTLIVGGGPQTSGSTKQDPYAAYKTLGAFYILDPSRPDLITVSGSNVTAAKTAGSGALTLTGTGLSLDTIDAINGRSCLSMPFSLATTVGLRSATGGVVGTSAPWSLSMFVRTVATGLFNGIAFLGGPNICGINMDGRVGPTQINFDLYNNGPAFAGVNTAPNPQLNAWIATRTYDGSNVILYEDGGYDSDRVANTGQTIVLPMTAPFGLGSAKPGSWQSAQAIIYDAVFYPSCLTLAQVRQDAMQRVRNFNLATPSVIYALGDSITAGTVSSPPWPNVALGIINSGRYEPAVLNNTAVSGRTINEFADPGTTVNARRAYSVRPRSMVMPILLGINDLRSGRTLSQMQTDYTTIVANGLACGFVPLVGTLVPDFLDFPPGSGGLDNTRVAFNTWLRGQGYPVMDFDALPGAYSSSSFADGLHPTVAFEAVMGVLAASVMKPLLS